LENKNLMFGMRSTGKLHLGHYEGVLKNMTALQEKFNCFIEVADWHSITTGYDADSIADNVYDMVVDWLAAGIDPQKSTIFVQSAVKEHAELFVLLSMMTPVSWLERVPTYKDQIQQLGLAGDSVSFGLLGYPVLQAVDIALYKAAHVPIGRDQLPHLEFTREIIRRFNSQTGSSLVEPQAVLTDTPMLLGLDNRKMSKSYGNSIFLSETAEETAAKIMKMITDPKRIKKTDPGDPNICNVYSYHKAYSAPELTARVLDECPKAAIGCVECKKLMAVSLNERLRPVRERRAEFNDRAKVKEILLDGNARARKTASETLGEVVEKMKMRYY